ncbi:MAG: hypothetical protein IJK26_04660 [Clostridia bacterium]|nr:hypothetical protein [Clostridia bacterium]
MIKGYNKKPNRISAKISDAEIQSATSHIEKAVDAHCISNNNKVGTLISVRILFGDKNKDWNGTDLQIIYDYHKNANRVKNPKNQAAKDVGWLFKQVLMDDKRTFEFYKKDSGNVYRLV